MKEATEYDVVVIGAGIAGMVSAVTAHGLGKKVAIVEKRSFGGNCSSYTCLPSKTLIRAGHIAKLSHNLEHYGLQPVSPVHIDNTNLMPHIKSLIAKANEKDAPQTFESIGIKTIIGTAEFSDAHHILVNGQTIASRYFIIATGTRPLVPPIKGLQDVKFLTNETIYDLASLPESMIILGGGAAGLEFASALGRLGVAVTIVEMAARLLANEDRELANPLLEQIRKDGVQIMSGTKAMSFSQEGEGVALTVELPNGKSSKLEAQSVLLAIGRKAEMEGLKLDRAGVKYTPRGIVINQKMQTSVPHIYACGDIAGPIQLASTAEYQGILAATNLFLPLKRRADYSNLAWVIFTEPTLAHLGLTEEQARQKHGDVIWVYRFDYAQMRRAMVDGMEHGLAKIICSRHGKILGAHILGEGASEVIHELQLIKSFSIPLQSIQSVTHGYPTYSQAIVGRAGQLAYLDSMRSSFYVKQFLKRVPGYQNRLEVAKQRLEEAPNLPVAQELELDRPVKVNTRWIEPNAWLVELTPELNYPDERWLLTSTPPRQPATRSYLLLDFSAVHYINGLGASMLVKLTTLASYRRQSVIAFGVNDHYRDVLKVTGLDSAIAVFSTQEGAFAALNICRNPATPGPSRAIPPQDSESWAKPVLRLNVPPMPPEALNRNLAGLGIAGPIKGFGPLWQKTYRLIVDQPGLTPQEAILILKQNFPRFQPNYNRFYPAPGGMQPGAVVAIDSSTPGGPVSTGVMVLFADANSFTFITPQGHPESGWVTFSAFREAGKIVVQILGLARANDPIYEAAFRAIGSQMQIKIWTHVLTSLATYLGVPANVTVQPLQIDSHVRWNQATNVWYNAQIRTLLYMPALGLAKVTQRHSTRKD